MIAHIVPETYLKSWKDPNNKNKIYVFDNKTLNCQSKNLNSMSSTLFTSINEYILRCDNCSSYIFKDLFADLFLEIDKKYDIFYKGKKLTKNSLRVFIKNIFNENNVEVFTKQNCKVRINKLKNDISEYWGKNISDEIEGFFNKKYENNWNDFKNYLENNMKNKEYLDNGYYEYMMDFISIQISRQKDRFLKIFQDIIKNSSSISQSEEYWLVELYKFVTFKNGRTINECNLVNLIINYFKNMNFSIKILRSCDLEFITSDNPIYYVDIKKWIVFPITPNTCIIIDENLNNVEKNKIQNINVNDNLVKSINKYTLDYSKRNVVFSKNSINNLLY